MKGVIKIFLLLGLINFGNELKAQETRPMTAKETAFYEKLLTIINAGFLQEKFGSWQLAEHTNTFYPRVLVDLPKDEGPYKFTYTLIFRKSEEAIAEALHQLTQKMEELTDPAEILKMGLALESITLNAEMRITITVNEEYSAFSSCNDKYQHLQFSNEEYKWGIDINHAASISTDRNNAGICKNETRLIIGAGKPFRFFAYDSDKGGALVSEFKLPVKKGDKAFEIYNLIVSVEAEDKEVLKFLNSIKWKLIVNNLSQL